jgi:twinkle protein
MPYSPHNWDKAGIDIAKLRGSKMKCPKCNHKDSLSCNLTTGLYKCHHISCDFKGCVADKPQYQQKKDFTPPLPRLQKVSDDVVDWFEQKRKISNNTLLLAKITESTEFLRGERKKAICFNYYRDGILVNIKFRSKDKSFTMSSGAELIPYNIDAAKGEEELIWVEGEIDALTCIECNCSNVVSVPNGASASGAKLEFIDNSWADIEHIKKHIIAVDDDEAGRKLKEALTYRLGIENCWFVKYPDEIVVDEKGETRKCKDLNEVLVHLGKDKVKECLTNLVQMPLSGVYYAENLADEIFEIFNNERIVGETTHYPEFDKIFKWKRREINLWFGYGNFGKTQVFLDKALTKSMYDDWVWAIFCPENFPATDFYIDLIEMYTGRHIDGRLGNKMTADELDEAIKFLTKHFIYVYPDEVQDLDTLHILFRSLILRHGVDGVLIDPWNQLDHIIDNREDLYLSKAFKEIKKFSLLNNISYNIIAHPKTTTPNKDGELPKIEVWHIAGGQMWRNKMDNIISVERPDWNRDKTSGWTRIETHKIKRRRTGGMLGECDFDYLVRQSRYTEKNSDVIICDPKRALKYKEGKLNTQAATTQTIEFKNYYETNNNNEEDPF